MSRPDCVEGCDGSHVHKWEVTPHPYSSDFDTFVTDSDDEARSAIMHVAEQAWDQCSDGMTMTVTIKRARMETAVLQRPCSRCGKPVYCTDASMVAATAAYCSIECAEG